MHDVSLKLRRVSTVVKWATFESYKCNSSVGASVIATAALILAEERGRHLMDI